MRNYIGHHEGQIIFATQSPDCYDFEPPAGMAIIEVDDATYAEIAPTVGQMKFRAADSGFVPIHEKPSEFHTWDWGALEWQQDRALAETSVRDKRARLLLASDWTQLPDVPLETKTAWGACRQALRDITDQAGFPFDVVWPSAPK